MPRGRHPCPELVEGPAPVARIVLARPQGQCQAEASGGRGGRHTWLVADTGEVVEGPLAVRNYINALHATMADAQFIRAAESIDVDIDPISGDQMLAILKRLYGMPPGLIERAKQAAQQ